MWGQYRISWLNFVSPYTEQALHLPVGPGAVEQNFFGSSSPVFVFPFATPLEVCVVYALLPIELQVSVYMHLSAVYMGLINFPDQKPCSVL